MNFKIGEFVISKQRFFGRRKNFLKINQFFPKMMLRSFWKAAAMMNSELYGHRSKLGLTHFSKGGGGGGGRAS